MGLVIVGGRHNDRTECSYVLELLHEPQIKFVCVCVFVFVCVGVCVYRS
jgi:hypothetical protein